MDWDDSGFFIIGICASGSRRRKYGKADLKSMMTGMGGLFNIDPGNNSSTFQESLERKKGFTNITDRMVDAIRKEINSSLNN